MRQRVAAWLGAGLVAVGAFRLVTARDAIAPVRFDRIRPGMTEGQVQALLGRPPGFYYDRHPHLFTMSGPFAFPLRASGRPFEVRPDGRHWVSSEGRPVTVQSWCGNTYSIEVAFDDREGVVGCSLSRNTHPEDSPLTALVDDLRVGLGW
jgi:hypothetical protein